MIHVPVKDRWELQLMEMLEVESQGSAREIQVARDFN
jgi:hypothetical protein